MISRLAEQGRKALIDAARRMTRTERLKAFVEHSRLMMELRLAKARRPASSK